MDLASSHLSSYQHLPEGKESSLCQFTLYIPVLTVILHAEDVARGLFCPRVCNNPTLLRVAAVPTDPFTFSPAPSSLVSPPSSPPVFCSQGPPLSQELCTAAPSARVSSPNQLQDLMTSFISIVVIIVTPLSASH